MSGAGCMSCSADGSLTASLAFLAGFCEGLKVRGIQNPKDAADYARTKLCPECLALIAGVAKGMSIGRMLTSDEFDRFITGKGIDS